MIRKVLIVILTILAICSAIFCVISFFRTILWTNQDYYSYPDIQHWYYSVVFRQGMLELNYTKRVPSSEPWINWRVEIRYFKLGHQRTATLDEIGQRSYWLWLPIFPLFVLFSIFPLYAFIRGPYRRYCRRKKGLCLKCGYNLTGNVSGVCPECGEKI